MEESWENVQSRLTKRSNGSAVFAEEENMYTEDNNTEENTLVKRDTETVSLGKAEENTVAKRETDALVVTTTSVAKVHHAMDLFSILQHHLYKPARNVVERLRAYFPMYVIYDILAHNFLDFSRLLALNFDIYVPYPTENLTPLADYYERLVSEFPEVVRYLGQHSRALRTELAEYWVSFGLY